MTAAETFWSLVEKTDGCWFWRGPSAGRGQGLVRLDGERVAAHRCAFFFAHGTWPTVVARTCDGDGCVRPDHLKAGGARLSASDIEDVRRLHSEGVSLNQIAKRYSVSREYIRAATLGVGTRQGLGRRPPKPVDLRSKLLRLVERVTESGCWIWMGRLDDDGYGAVTIWNAITRKAVAGLVHRILYELLVGPVPDGLQLDHLCRVRCCVNPDHLEPVTPAENTRRGLIAEHAEDDHQLALNEDYYRTNPGARPAWL